MRDGDDARLSDEHASAQLRGDRRLVAFDLDGESVDLRLPPFLRRRADALDFAFGDLYSVLQPFDRVAR